MAWVYLDDQFPDHPKVVAAGEAAAWMFVCGLAYCRRYNTAGRIPKAQIPKLTGNRQAIKLAGRLVAAPAGYERGLWEDHGDHYLVHDYDEWNKPQKSRSEAGKKAAQARWARESDANRNANASETHNGTDANAPADAVRDPVPQDAPRARSLSLSPTGLHPPPTHVGTRPEPGGGDESLVDQAIRLAADRYAQHEHDAGRGRSVDGLARWWLQENADGARQRAVNLLEDHDLNAAQLADALSSANPPWLRAYRRRPTDEGTAPAAPEVAQSFAAAARHAIEHPNAPEAEGPADVLGSRP